MSLCRTITVNVLGFFLYLNFECQGHVKTKNKFKIIQNITYTVGFGVPRFNMKHVETFEA